METTANTYDDIITRSYEEYYQVILTYITYRITHRYEAEDLTQDVFVRLLDYKQMLRPDTVKYFLFTIARNIVIDYIRRYYKKQEIDSYIYDTMSTSTNETEEKIIGDDLMTMERTRLAAYIPTVCRSTIRWKNSCFICLIGTAKTVFMLWQTGFLAKIRIGNCFSTVGS